MFPNLLRILNMPTQFDALVAEVAAVKLAVASAVAKMDDLVARATPVDLSGVTADLKAASDSLNSAVALHTAPTV